MKAPDSTAIPLCQRHHREFHDANGAFYSWDKVLRRYWSDEAIEATRAAVAAGRQGA